MPSPMGTWHSKTFRVIKQNISKLSLRYENTSDKTYHTNAYTLVLHYTCIEISNADSLGIIYLLKNTITIKQTSF